MTEPFKDISQIEKDMIMDVAAGICYAQKAWDAQKGTYDLSKVKVYKPKTKIPQIIQEALEESGYRKFYEWEYDKNFVSDGYEIEVVKYDIQTDDWCIVLFNGEKKKITKRYLRELWEERENKI